MASRTDGPLMPVSSRSDSDCMIAKTQSSFMCFDRFGLAFRKGIVTGWGGALNQEPSISGRLPRRHAREPQPQGLHPAARAVWADRRCRPSASHLLFAARAAFPPAGRYGVIRGRRRYCPCKCAPGDSRPCWQLFPTHCFRCERASACTRPANHQSPARRCAGRCTDAPDRSAHGARSFTPCHRLWWRVTFSVPSSSSCLSALPTSDVLAWTPEPRPHRLQAVELWRRRSLPTDRQRDRVHRTSALCSHVASLRTGAVEPAEHEPEGRLGVVAAEARRP